MKMDNYLIKTLAFNKQALILFVENTGLIQVACNQSNHNKLLKTALGRTISATSLLSGILKDGQRISLKVKTSNRHYGIFADADSSGNVRGYLSDELINAPAEYFNQLSIEQLIGSNGCIQITKDIGMNHIFTGITDMPYANIVDDISHYFKQSEQTPSFFSLTVMFNDKNEIVLSRGVMAQLLPGAPAHLFHQIRNVISDHQCWFTASENSIAFTGFPHMLFDDLEIISIEPLQLLCECSKEFFYPMLYALGQEELKNTCENNQSIELVCNMCGKKHSFQPVEIAKLIS